MNILLVEGDAHYAQWLSEKLAAAGFRAIMVLPEASAFATDEAQAAVATIIDADSKRLDAWQAIRRVRGAGHQAPLLVISGRENWREKVDCLDAGADDFVVKPIRSEEISARLRAMIRRAAGRSSDKLVHGRLVADIRNRCVWLDGEALDLTRNEFRLASRLLMWPHRIHTTDEIREMIQAPGDAIGRSANAVEVLVTRLRRKIGRETIRTVRGVGYRLSPDTNTEATVSRSLPSVDGPCIGSS